MLHLQTLVFCNVSEAFPSLLHQYIDSGIRHVQNTATPISKDLLELTEGHQLR